MAKTYTLKQVQDAFAKRPDDAHSTLWIHPSGCVLVIQSEAVGKSIYPIGEITETELKNFAREVGHIRIGQYKEIVGTIRTLSNLAEATGVSENYIRQLEADGKIVPVQKGSKGIPSKYDDTAFDTIIETLLSKF